MMEDSDILTLGWGCEPPVSSLWPPSGEEFVTLDVEEANKESQEFATLEVAKERDRQYYTACVDPVDVKLHHQVRSHVWRGHVSRVTCLTVFVCRACACRTGTSCA